MASTTANITRRLETAIPMTRFSISEDEDDHPVVFKRARLSVSTSQPRRSCVAVEEDHEDLVPVEHVESDSDESAEVESGDDDSASETSETEEEVEVRENIGSDDEDSVDFAQERQVTSVRAGLVPRGQSNVGVVPPAVSASLPVANSGNGELQVVLTDPDVLDCPICLEALCNPVFQCENGHIACSSCCSKVNRKCPSCCMPIGYNRCRAIEKVIESIKVSCKNAQHGCKETLTYSKKLDHEQTCPHTACSCPLQSCTFVGSSKNLYLHFGVQHAASTARFTYNTTFSLSLMKFPKRFFLQEQHESVVFILNQEYSLRGWSVGLDCVGLSSLNTGLKYQISAKNMESTLSLQGVPQMYTNWSEHALKKNYLTIPLDFFDDSGVTHLHVCIKKAL